MNVQHSAKDDDWMTPLDIIEAVRKVLGVIDLDPASSEVGNERVKARNYFTREKDGLNQDWCGSIFVNPPGGKTGNKSNTVLFWEKLMQSDFDHAIFLAFSIEALQTTQGKGFGAMTAYPLCIPSKRLRFVNPRDGRLNSPTHASAIAYVPLKKDKSYGFAQTFKQFGDVINYAL